MTETAAPAVECINWDEHVVVRIFSLAGAVIESHSGGTNYVLPAKGICRTPIRGGGIP